MLNMDIIESAVGVEKCTDLVKARISRRLSEQPVIRMRSFVATDTSSPTKELDAVVLANTLVGYGEKLRLKIWRSLKT